MRSFIESIAKLAESVNSDKKESGQTKLHEPDAFNGSDLLEPMLGPNMDCLDMGLLWYDIVR
jgi:hypothetical protein